MKVLIVFGSSLQMNIDKKERNLLAVSTGDGRDTHQAGWELWFVVVLTEYFFRLWAWIWSLRGKGTFLIYWIYHLVADTWWYTHGDTQCQCSPDNWHSYYQFLRTSHVDLSWSFNIRDWSGKTMYLPGMVCDMFWLIIYKIIIIVNIIYNIPATLSHLGIWFAEGVRDRWSVQSVLRRDVASRVREARELSGDEDPFSHRATLAPPILLIQRHPGSPWHLAGLAKAPHFCTTLKPFLYKSRDPSDWCNPAWVAGA